ncbi:MAG: hypothetical protein D6795_13805 [Deltaproteobacteria bacterium]|nr:MAG: hypothetical protein D6795_13805 [Deltaproteobacteria bacterium]
MTGGNAAPEETRARSAQHATWKFPPHRITDRATPKAGCLRSILVIDCIRLDRPIPRFFEKERNGRGGIEETAWSREGDQKGGTGPNAAPDTGVEPTQAYPSDARRG